MLSILVLLFPLLLMAFMLLMERVEDSLRVGDDGDVEEFLETAAPDEVDTLVREGFGAAFVRWRGRRRHRFQRLLPSRPGPAPAGTREAGSGRLLDADPPARDHSA